jgi:lipoate-protein ligase A
LPSAEFASVGLHQVTEPAQGHGRSGASEHEYALPAFGFVTVHRQPLAGGVAHEADWLTASAALGQASAHLWTAPTGIVVPRRYTALPGWAVAASDAGHGQVQVRSSGGGLVPQGPGVWNLSLAWPAPSSTPTSTEAVYQGLSDELAAALSRLGVAAAPQAVAGSFCDGRYNLAAAGRKLVGTAQAWRRVDGVPMVLAHAVIVVTADPAALTARANALEAALGTATRYREDAMTSVALASAGPANVGPVNGPAEDPTDIEARTITALAEQFARVLAPRAQPPKETTHGAA